jgi:shikimate kinase
MAESEDRRAGAGPEAGSQRRPVFLVGMMGAGKSTVGRLLAHALHYEFIDCDTELERRAGVRIATMFEVEGEAGFRARESALLEELTLRPATVLATGGGAVLDERNRAWLRERGVVVFLDVDAAEIARRTRHDTSRPLLQAGDRRSRIEELLDARLPLYRATAHLRMRSPARNPRRLVTSLLSDPEFAALRGAPADGAGAPVPSGT